MANIYPYGCFTHAVVRGIPESFGKLAEGGEGLQTDLAKAQRQMGVLTGALRQKVGLQLIEIPAVSELPESWRIEDVAVIQGDTALITRPLKQQRRAEAEAVRRVLNELKLTVLEMGDEEGRSAGATLEGSDVLFTGKEFFVGISKHTNHRGAEVLADTFKDFAVSTVPVCGGSRLKNICSMGGPDTIIISSSDGAKKTLRMMEQLTDHHYEILTVPEDVAANCVYIRGPAKVDFLLHPTAEECPNSVPAFQRLTDYTLLPTACSEASKLGAALSSLCLLINKKPNY
ncbi:N(G),N(G)-dimethylarginine dimethylaminohydrolase 2 [Carassius auratus]|uniref:N(G),N(G)-dimethylarginine dimethylaminohydrolase 2-like n=1 Tax=Carassius auratus TaxID=7957 RepID=A0A6P6RG25_CARAU|nr:N(G),N(G)-dimethylarginine dimethylaminohydrolase 2-like [Carassius auratus]XP_026144128.1 N(G),N(G)-dimethylarginine dimethylaminohydrolase 2-like [Carassius auratus]XP_026144130.1 N(G),N(G)-dimethylarginine dimethylaminohydrolase 2-like [Carassius auratus]XP_026144131.1 N(G),N(G)-dimethylarginine dimethylaminohydrolase 2-like [Carassius auratus]XP_052440504.1 N(G),N(G)-dimethylarginine dimethylaminohydrolase 2 [Carassius gibelio]XP_052440505.1 N(G),N(G)-dimethylarginine dimethylaminohydro